MKTLTILDSGASISCVSQRFANCLQVKINPLPSSNTVCYSTANGSPLILVGTVSLTSDIQGLRIEQNFAVIKQLNYNMILGIDFTNSTHTTIDFKSHTVSICDNLVVQPLTVSKLPCNVVRSMCNVQIPPLAEAILPLWISKNSVHYHWQYLIEPLSTLPDLHIGLARAVVPITHKATFCHVINPTNATVSIKCHTPLATISPIPVNAVIEYTKSKQPHPTPWSMNPHKCKNYMLVAFT